MEYRQLQNGIKMPVLGFGVYQIHDEEQCERSVLTALETGYRLIDTAAAYRNEEAVGRVVKGSGISREELFITTKLWASDTGYENTRHAFQKSLEKLQLDYLDLYLIHQPLGDVHGSWRAMEELYSEGKIRAIGVSNFHPDRVMDLIIYNKIPPMVNQIETHPFCQQIETQKFLSDNGVQIESWGPFAEGRDAMFQNRILASIGASHKKSVAQVILRWLIQRGVIAIPKSVHKERIVENFQVFDFELSLDEMDTVETLDRNRSSFFDHRDPQVVKRLGSVKLED